MTTSTGARPDLKMEAARAKHEVRWKTHRHGGELKGLKRDGRLEDAHALALAHPWPRSSRMPLEPVRRSQRSAVSASGGRRRRKPHKSFVETEFGRAPIGRLTPVQVPGVAAPGQQDGQRDEDGDDDRDGQRPA